MQCVAIWLNTKQIDTKQSENNAKRRKTTRKRRETMQNDAKQRENDAKWRDAPPQNMRAGSIPVYI